MRNRRRVLVIGGAGAIGTALTEVAPKHSVDIDILDIEIQHLDRSKLRNILEVDRSHKELLLEKVRDLRRSIGTNWSAILDCALFSTTDARIAEQHLFGFTSHYIAVSTCLVKTYKSLLPTAKMKYESRGYHYVKQKLEIEGVFKHSIQHHWSIVRTGHILGNRTYVGCTPPYNRSPKLLSILKAGRPIELVYGGKTRISYINPHDLAEVICRITNRSRFFQAEIDIGFPRPTTALEYYTELAEILGPKLKSVRVEQIPDYALDTFWELTLSDQTVDTSEFFASIHYDPIYELTACLTQAVLNPPLTTIAGIQQRHRHIKRK